MGPPSSPPPELQRMKPRCSLSDPTSGSPSPQTIPQRPSPAYITTGPSVPAGGQAFLLTFQELLGTREKGSCHMLVGRWGAPRFLSSSPPSCPEGGDRLQREEQAPNPSHSPVGPRRQAPGSASPLIIGHRAPVQVPQREGVDPCAEPLLPPLVRWVHQPQDLLGFHTQGVGVCPFRQSEVGSNVEGLGTKPLRPGIQGLMEGLTSWT